MEVLIQILLALIFYGLMWFFYSYSKGKYKVKEEKQEQYSQWVEKNGEKASKAIRVLTIIFSVVFIFNIFASI